VTVVIEDVVSNIGLLRGQKPFQDVTDIFATYLRDYPGLRLVYDGTPVDPRNAEETSATYGLGELVLENGEVITAELAIVEWELPGKRGIMFCDEHGYVLAPARAKPYFRGFSYTAYLNSAHFRRLEQEGLLDVPEMAPDVRRLTEEAKRLLRRHFAAREDARGGDVLTRWKESGLYPYDGPPRNTAERKERRIFDIYAAHLAHAPGVKDAPAESQRMALRLLRELVRAEPVGAARALDAVLTLPEADRQELAALSGG
jgi:hypothetical protein